MTTDSLGQLAYDVVEHLSVRIGPRRAGSQSEARALDYVEAELRQSCDCVRRIPVKGIPAEFPRKILLLVGMLSLVYTVNQLLDAPQAMVIYLVAFYALPKLISATRKSAATTSERESANIIGHQSSARERCGTIILCAHIDTARATRVPGERWPKIHQLLMRLWLPFVVSMTAVAVLRWLDARVALAPITLWQAIRALGLAFSGFLLVFESFYMYISRSEAFSPGANDNASGVGVVLALARHLRDDPLAHLDVKCALFTAEELGLIGSERFAKETDLQKNSTYVINLDMVGTGKELCYVRGSGLLPPRMTDRELNSLLRESHPAITRHYYFMGDSDFGSFSAQGFRTASLCAKGGAFGEPGYHTDRDTIDNISLSALQLAADTVHKAVRLLDERLGLLVPGVQ
jgi:hypothetical protein